MDSLIRSLRHLKKLLRLRGETRERAEDLVQEAYLRMQVYRKEGGAVRDAEAFLMRTALNLAIDTRRREHLELYTEERVEELEIVDLAPTPDEVFAAEERLLRMWALLEKAGKRTQEAFFLHRLNGCSYAEIAAQMGMSVSAIEKYIAQALTMLTMERQQE